MANGLLLNNAVRSSLDWHKQVDIFQVMSTPWQIVELVELIKS